MIWAYVLTLPFMAAIDLLWIGVFMKSFYTEKLDFILSGSIRPLPAVLFYLAFVAGLFYFAVVPGYVAGSLQKTIVAAALLGALAYATYDLTNMATIAAWPLSVTVVDIIWGAVIAAATSAVGYWLLSFFGS